MLAKRIVPCLDVKDGLVVKGVQFNNLLVEGDPVELAVDYEQQGADELVFLDISASYEKRRTMLEVVRKVAREVSIPFTVGGGIRAIEDIQNILCAGADKVSLNTAAVKNPLLIKEASKIYGRQCIVVAIDAKRKTNLTNCDNNEWEVYVEGGRKSTTMDVLKWALKVKELGAGELLPTSMDCDGMKNGYDLELNEKLSDLTNLPIIASGGAGTLKHIYDVLTIGKADAALAASIFHRGTYSINDVKSYLKERNVPVRMI